MGQKATGMLCFLIFVCATSLVAQTKPHQLTLDELKMCNREVETYEFHTRTPRQTPPKPPHTTVNGLKLWQIGYVIGIHSYGGKLWVLSGAEVFPSPTDYDFNHYDVAIKKSPNGVWLDCSGSPFVIVDNADYTWIYTPIDGQWNSTKKP